MDVGTQIAHGAVRSYVMGERGARNEAATPEDIASHEAVGQGGHHRRGPRVLHVAHHRPPGHRRRAGARAPSPPRTSCSASGAALGELGTGIFELAPPGSAGEDIIGPKKEVDWMRRLSAAIHRPVTFALLQVDAAPTSGAS